MRQRMQEELYQTADAEVSLSDSGCRRHSIRQRMQRVSSIRQRIERLLHQQSDRGTPIRCLIEIVLYQTADKETPASAV